MIGDLQVEQAHVILMNQNFKMLKHVKLSEGGLTETAVDVRLIIKEAVQCNATIVALAHNHQVATPNQADKMTCSHSM